MNTRRKTHPFGRSWRAEVGKPPVAAATEEEYQRIKAELAAARLAYIEAQRAELKAWIERIAVEA
jgi:hypothetical protein